MLRILSIDAGITSMLPKQNKTNSRFMSYCESISWGCASNLSSNCTVGSIINWNVGLLFTLNDISIFFSYLLSCFRQGILYFNPKLWIAPTNIALLPYIWYNLVQFSDQVDWDFHHSFILLCMVFQSGSQ